MFGGNFSNDLSSRTGGAPAERVTTSHSQDDEKIPTSTKDETLGEASKTATPADTDTVQDDDSSDMSEMARRDSLVHDLARRFTQQSHYSHLQGQTPVNASDDSPLNPNSEHFSAKAWARSVANMVREGGGEFPTSGVCFQDLDVYGYGQASDFQKSVGNLWVESVGLAKNAFGAGPKRRIDILRSFDGLVKNGEMLVVLGPPGSGCTTFLKTIAGEMNGIHANDDSYFNYQGMTAQEMHTSHRGEAIYTAEVDVHFPQLLVGETLSFAAEARAPRILPEGITQSTYARHMRDVVMAMFGISHTINTRVGNEYVRGVSGGERKRVTIAEATLSGAPLQCWDNSTRGLDSANAVEFCKTLKLQTETFNTTSCVSIYQAPQSAYDLFDKTLVIYEGYQIFFGSATAAKQYFIDLGFDCPARQTVPDFLTSMTSPTERIVRDGWEGRAPRTPEEFGRAWKNSQAYKNLQVEIEEYKAAHPLNGADAEKFRQVKKAQQAKGQREKSPYTLSYGKQIKLCIWRGYRRLAGDPGMTISGFVMNILTALISGSVWYNLGNDTSDMNKRATLCFFALLMNAFSCALEILSLYAQRPIVEKHDRYALYHPSAEAISSMVVDLPNKLLNLLACNIPLYFMTNLNRTAGAFFFWLLASFLTIICMSMIFRTIGSSARSLSQAMVPAAVIILALVMFNGFVIPVNYMPGWCRWINYIDPLAYGLEALVINEFHGREFLCTTFVPSNAVPGYENVGAINRVCSAVGAVAGEATVSGDAFMKISYDYDSSHKWRNIGFYFCFIIFFCLWYMAASEWITEKPSKGEVLIFRRGYKPASHKEKVHDAENAMIGPVPTNPDRNAQGYESGGSLAASSSTFHWNNVCYDIKIKGEPRRILDHVDGWVKPGSLTALMGVSGAGKTTLLDCLADRVNMGVITGEMLVDGHPRDASFQRKTGYVQQQDLHLATSTVREALNFSALLRQPASTPRAEKLAYVDQVIKILEMEEYAEAVVGVPGTGLNVEQRKRLTVGVELAAKPPLLLFVDEPTSGLDSQTSWAILDLLEKLTAAGQAILCTIHQPSAMLFQRFDRLLFLAKGGRTVYYGDIGENSKVMTSYFERNGGHPCPAEANPAEWMLGVIGAANGTRTDIDWPATWRKSPEYAATQAELARLKSQASAVAPSASHPDDYRQFAAPFAEQLQIVCHRVFQQYWRTPTYIYSKFALCTLVALFIGFAFFDADTSLQGMANQSYSIFMIFTVFGQLAQQTMPHFVVQRDLYEVRERPSKVYDWKVFMMSMIAAELPWNCLMAVFMFVCWYYPIGLDSNASAADQVTERSGLMFLYLLSFLLFSCTFTDLVIAGCGTAETGGNICNGIFLLCLIFCGIVASPDDYTVFWIWMYRVSPFTYIAEGMLSTGLANTNAVCRDQELTRFAPPSGQTCGDYLADYIPIAGGYLQDSNATDTCEFCTIGDTNVWLSGLKISYSHRWRDIGFMWVYICFNMVAALGVYWLFRVPKKGGILVALGLKKMKEE